MEEHNHTIQYIIAHQIDQSQSVCSKKDYDKKTLFYSLVFSYMSVQDTVIPHSHLDK